MDAIRGYLNDVSRLVAELPVEQIGAIVERLLAAYDGGKQLLLLGNGGSAATASHLMNDFQKCIYLTGGKPFRALALTDNVPVMTAWANDESYEVVFAEQMRAWAGPGDIVIAISGSGNSPNILRAIGVAREQGAWTLGLAGYQGGKLKELVDECIVVPCDNMQRIEDVHMVIGHLLFWRMMGRLEERKAVPNLSMRQAIFLDRDGVINENRDDYVKSAAEFRFLPGSAPAVARLTRAGHAVYVVSNQAGVGRGRMTREDLDAVTRKMITGLEAAGACAQGVYYCLHRPEDGCDCRKPLAGLLQQAIREHEIDPSRSIMVGDHARDLEAGAAVGARGILVLSGKTSLAEAARLAPPPDHVAADLSAAVDWILATRE